MLISLPYLLSFPKKPIFLLMKHYSFGLEISRLVFKLYNHSVKIHIFSFLFSLLGGVQLFAMIKMLGLIKEDMSTHQNEIIWYGYQVSMRILEVTLCTLLAIIATTPLRYDNMGK